MFECGAPIGVGEASGPENHGVVRNQGVDGRNTHHVVVVTMTDEDGPGIGEVLCKRLHGGRVGADPRERDPWKRGVGEERVAEQ